MFRDAFQSALPDHPQSRFLHTNVAWSSRLPGVMKPHAGVTTTRPATAPEQKPSTLAFLRTMYSSTAHVAQATPVASVVVVKALAAMPSAATAEPALKPY